MISKKTIIGIACAICVFMAGVGVGTSVLGGSNNDNHSISNESESLAATNSSEENTSVEGGVTSEENTSVEGGVTSEENTSVEGGVTSEENTSVEGGVTSEENTSVEGGVTSEENSSVEDSTSEENSSSEEDGEGDETEQSVTYIVSNPERVESEAAIVIIKGERFEMWMDVLRLEGTYEDHNEWVCLNALNGWWLEDGEWVAADNLADDAYVDVVFDRENKTVTVIEASLFGALAPTTRSCSVVNPKSVGALAMTITMNEDNASFQGEYDLKLDGRNVHVSVRGLYTVTDGVYHWNASSVNGPAMNGEVEATATEWDVYGTVNTETNEITITAPGGTIETQWGREFKVANPQDMGATQIDIKFHADNTFEYFAIIPIDGNKYAQATVKGVYTITDGIYFLDARNAHVVNGDNVIDEELSPDALMFDLYGYLVLEEGVFMRTGGGSSPSNGQNPNNP